MAIKVKRKQSTREAAKQPDQIYTFGERVFNTLEENRRVVLIGLAAVLLAIVIVAFIVGRVSKASLAEGAEVTSATRLLAVPVGEEPSEPGETVFESRLAQSESIREALSGLLSDSNPPPAARVLDAVSSLTLDDIARAQADFEAASDVEAAPMLSVVSLQGLASTQAEIGDLPSAQMSLSRIGETSPALIQFAELEAARLDEAAGNLRDAYDRYQQIAERGTIVGPEGPVQGLETIVESARHRAKVLAAYLGVTDEGPSAPEGTGSGEPGGS